VNFVNRPSAAAVSVPYAVQWSFGAVVVLILGLAFVITRLIEHFDDKANEPSASQSQLVEDGSIPTDGETPGVSAGVLAPLPGGADPGDMSWNTVGPVQQTLNYTVQAPDYRLIALPENGIVDLKYFDRTVIVGDSVSTGWWVYPNPLKEHAFICAYRNIGPNALVNKQELDAQYVGRSMENAYDTIINSNPLRVYILLGANSLVRAEDAAEDGFLAYYGQLLDLFRQDLGPDVKIYVQSVTPVRPGITQPGLTRDRLMRVNNKLAALALEKGCYFLNIYDALADEEGNLREDYAAADGVHLNQQAYQMLSYYLSTHTAWDPANPYLPGSPCYVAPVE